MSAKKTQWLTVRNEKERARIDICGTIGSSWWDDSGTSEKEFRDALKDIPKGQPIECHINSEGGSVKDGLGIYNALKDRRPNVTTIIDGYAVSIASVIALAGNKVVSPKSSIWMIHEPWSMTQGNAEDHLKSAEMLDKHGDMMASIYSEEVGKPKSEMRDAMKKESWFTGDEATEYGLADETPEGDGDDDGAKAIFAGIDVKSYKNIPEKIRTILAAAPKSDPPFKDTERVTGAAASLSTPKEAGSKPAGTAASQHNNQGNQMENPTQAAVNPPANHADEIAQLKAQLDTEKKARITREVNSHVESLRIPSAQAEKWITRAMKDETVLADLAALPVNRPGGEPIGHVIEGRSVPLEDIRKEPVAAKRFVTMRDDWNALLSDALKRDSYAGRSLPVNANSYQSALVTQFLLDGAVTKLQNRWAMLKAFTKDYSTDTYKPLATAQLKYVTAGSATLTNATNFEQGNSTVGNVAVTVSQYSQPFQVSTSDLNSGLRMENLVTINTAAFANKVTEVATAPITIANFETTGGQTHLVSAPATFGFSDMATLWGQLKKSDIKNLILDGEYLARIINNPTLFQATGADAGSGWKAFGWDGVYLNTDWTGADANVRGFACNPQAIAAVAGLPLTAPNIPGATLQQSVSTVPDVNVSFAAYSWFSLASRTMWMSYDIMFGASAADTTAGVLVTSA